ncbi:SAM-dependent methyltransferase [Allorhodopirellula solitaria]|nr:cyclopropane-fatty-acyl-phospholipid synthase family protein [Allorhodopirellula solitaria]
MSSGTTTERPRTDWNAGAIPSVRPERNAATLGWMQRLTRHKMLNWLSSLEGGQVQFSDPQSNEVFGSWESPHSVSWQIHDPTFYSLLATQGSLGLAESYLCGHWEVDDLTTFLRILCRNLGRTSGITTRLASAAGQLRRLAFRLDNNSRRGSRRHIAAHYDLSNEFFEMFLDPTMMYSSAWFESADTPLHDASRAKIDRVCGKLKLQPTDHLLEIGTGWGGFALHAAQQYGCQVTTTTISQAQFEMTRDRVRRAGLSERIDTLASDYRDLNGRYDKLVSIEVVEAIGERHLDDFFRQSSRLLKPGGRCVMQAIVMPEQRYQSYRRSVDFIQKYIFPGGFLPSIAAIQDSVGRSTSFRLDSIEDISPHYAQTLSHWRERFQNRLADVRSLGFDDRFIRMWEFYLCYCEAAFREHAVRVVQIAWDKPAR